MRQLLSPLALCAAAALSAGSLAAQAPAEFDPADFGKIIIQPRQSAGGAGIVFEQAIGDYQNEPIITYGENSPIVRLGKPIGRLDMLFEGGKTGFCTAFIVDDMHIVTNHHCIPGMDGDPSGATSGVQAAQFVAGFIKPGNSQGVDRFTVSPQIVETSRELDYTVLRVFGNPSTKYGRLELAAADPEDSEFLWIIGHPQGQSQHISREGCAAAIPAISDEGKLMHSCDTLGGNSGSPVIRLSDKRVIGLHHAGDSRTGFNMAIPMTRILAQSRVLHDAAAAATAVPVAQPAVRQPAPQPQPQPAVAPKPAVVAPSPGDSCTALWAEAKTIGCAGYEAYVSECGGHLFATMASRLIERECAVPAVAPPQSGGPRLTVKAGGGGDYTGIQAAIAAAEPGMRIEVHPGTYTQGLDVTKPVEIVGIGNRADIVLRVAEDNAVRWTAESGRIANLTILQDGGQYFGFHIAAGSVVLEDSELSSRGLAVMAVRGNEGATIRRNVIRDGAQGGIFLFEGGRALIEDNEIFGHALGGIEVKEGADPIVRGNTLRDGAGSGLFVNDGGRGRYEGNQIFNNALANVEVKGADDPLITGNVVRNGLQGGIMVSDGASARIENNTVFANAYAGLEIKSGANPTVWRNEFRDGAQSAIYVHEGGKGVIEDNDIHHNAFYGISVKGKSEPIVRENRIYGNSYEAIRVREGAAGTYEDNDLSGNAAGAFRIEEDAGALIRRGNKE
jgi:parallel beta-helix repeat protein